MTTKNDEIIEGLFKKVQEKKAEIAKAEKPQWQTNCAFVYDNSSTVMNIQVISNIDVLVDMLSYILIKSESHKQVVKRLDLQEREYKYMGFTVDEWESDIKTRINKIQITSKKKELDELEKKLNSLVSPEKRTEMELAEIAKKLS